MTDRIVLSGMRFSGHHGVTDPEREAVQPIEVDVEMVHDLRAAGASD
ncbi:MAG: dihydroneopterin aldolase, partial [Candidatus Limnocylindrales bacterium]